MTTPALLTQFFQQYQQTQTKRALGGIYALQGFDFQIECYLADLLQHLAKSDTDGIQNSLSAFEQLQDHTLVVTTIITAKNSESPKIDLLSIGG